MPEYLSIIFAGYVVCPTCKKQYKNKNTLAVHRSRDCNRKEGNLRCIDCGKLYKTYNSLQAHRSRYCGKIISTYVFNAATLETEEVTRTEKMEEME